MNQLWILNHYAGVPQSPFGGGTRHFSMARHLLDYGWDTTIIASSVQHCTGRHNVEMHNKFRIDDISGIRFVRISSLEYSGNGIGRIMNMIIYSMRALLPKYTANLPDPKVIIGSSVHPLAAISGAMLARRYKVPFIFEVRDLWPQTLIDMGRLKSNSVVTKTLKRIEKSLYNEAKRIIVLLPQAHEYITPLGISKNKIIWISNGTEITPYQPRDVTQHASQFVLMYFGAHGTANCLDTLLDSIRILNERELHIPLRLRMIGEGRLKSKLIEKARQLELDNVSFEGPVPKNEIPNLASEADSFVIVVKDLPGLYRYGISMNKIFDYMVAGRPTVIAVNSANNPIAEAGAGLTVAPEDPVALADGIEEMVNLSYDERKRMGLRARRHVENYYSYHVLAEKLARTLDDACENRFEIRA